MFVAVHLVKKEDYGRTSENTWDSKSVAAKAMIKRSFQLTNIEENDGKRDGLQIVRYKPGQGYNTHPDFFTPNKNTIDGDADFDFNPYSGGSNRFATVFMYLNSPDVGGSTSFPYGTNHNPNYDAEASLMPDGAKDMFKVGTWEYNVNRDCYAPNKINVEAIENTAALFYSITADGQIDEMSHHAACPLIDGIKWGANIWIWNKQRYGDVRTGDATKLKVTNKAPEDVFLVWESKPNGVISPGESYVINTFEYHRFKASFGSFKEKSFTSFTVQEKQQDPDDNEDEFQVWDIEPPRNYKPSNQYNQGVAFHAKNDFNHVVEVLYEGESLGIAIAPGESVLLNSFPGHILQAAKTNDGFIISTITVKSDSKVWHIIGDDIVYDEL